MKLIIVFFLFFTESLVAQRLPNLIPYKKGNLWGYADTNKKIVVSPIYDEVGHFINSKKDLNSDNRWDWNIAIVWSGNKCGAIDTNGKLVIPVQYDKINLFDGHEKKNLVEIQLKAGTSGIDYLVGLADYTGKIIAAPKYYMIDYEKNYIKLIHASYDANPEYITYKGKPYTPDLSVFKNKGPEAKAPGIPYDAEIKFKIEFSDSLWGVRNNDGKLIIPYKYNATGCDGFWDGISVARKGKFWGAVDTGGKEVVPFEYSKISPFSFNSQLSTAKKGGCYGVISRTGEVVVPFQYDDINIHYHTDWINVKIDNKFGLFYKGNKVISPNYPKEIFVAKGMLYTKLDTAFVIFDTTGKIKYTVPIETGKRVSIDKEGFVLTSQYGKTRSFNARLMDINKNLVANYDAIYNFNSDFAIVKSNDLFGCIDKQGKIIIPLIYNRLTYVSYGIYEAISQSGNTYFVDRYGKEYYED